MVGARIDKEIEECFMLLALTEQYPHLELGSVLGWFSLAHI